MPHCWKSHIVAHTIVTRIILLILVCALFDKWADVDSLLNDAPIVNGDSVFCLCCILHYVVTFLVCNHLNKEERVGCFTLIVFPMYCDC